MPPPTNAPHAEHLAQSIFDTLIERVAKISQLDIESQAWQRTMPTQVILANGS